MRRGVFTLALLSCACASIQPERGHDLVNETVEERLGISTGWGEGDPGAEAIARRVDELLAEGLTEERAVQIALLNNPSLQATYAGLGISQADLVQAGLLSNPVIVGSVGFPIGNAVDPRVEYEASIAQSLLDLFILPLRKRVAGERFIADALLVADETLATAAAAKIALIRYQAAERALQLERILLQTSLASAAEAEARLAAGNATRLEADRERAAYEEARHELASAELERIEARESLNRALGLWGPRTSWTLAEPLPEPFVEALEIADLESLAIRQRLDVAAAREQALLMENAVRIARVSRYTGPVEVGVHVHQDPDGPRLLGPTLSLKLPLFDRRQAMIARLEAQRSQAERRLDALSIEARSAVRVGGARLLAIRQRLEHQARVLLPLRERIVQESQLQYNAMQIGLGPLLEARAQQARAYKRYLDTVRDYWIARAELERLVGGSLRPAPASPREGGA